MPKLSRAIPSTAYVQPIPSTVAGLALRDLPERIDAVELRDVHLATREDIVKLSRSILSFFECDFRAVQRSALRRSRRELSNAYVLAKFGFDTAENEPCQVCPMGTLSGEAERCVDIIGVNSYERSRASAERRPCACSRASPG